MIEKHAYYLGGIAGSGKTSITRVISELDPSTSVLHGSRKMLEYFGVNSYADLNIIPGPLQKEARLALYQKALVDAPGNLFIDAHYVLFGQGDKPVEVVDQEFTDKIGAFFHIIADPELIMERTFLDQESLPRRKNNLLTLGAISLDSIKRSQEVSVRCAEGVSEIANAPLKIVENNESIEHAAHAVLRLASSD